MAILAKRMAGEKRGEYLGAIGSLMRHLRLALHDLLLLDGFRLVDVLLARAHGECDLGRVADSFYGLRRACLRRPRRRLNSGTGFGGRFLGGESLLGCSCLLRHDGLLGRRGGLGCAAAFDVSSENQSSK